MTGQQLHDTPRPNHSTGPITPEGKPSCRLNAYRHGLTGQLCVFAPDEQRAYEKHCKVVHEALAPAGDFERDLAQSIADDHWRLKRARAIEASMFGLGAHEHAADTTGQPDVDAAFAQARTWEKQARNLQLLTVYEQRIRRAVDKNMVQLKILQVERKQAAKQAMEQAKLLYRFAQAQGKPYRPEAFFITAPEVRDSVFSSAEIAHELSRATLLNNAENYAFDGRLPAPGGRSPNAVTAQSATAP